MGFSYRVYDVGDTVGFAWTGYAVFRVTGEAAIIASSPSLDELRLKAAAGGWESEVEPAVWVWEPPPKLSGPGRGFRVVEVTGWRPGPEVFR